MIDLVMPSSEATAKKCLTTALSLGMTGLCFVNPKFPLPSENNLPLYTATKNRTKAPLSVALTPQEVASETDILFDVEPLEGKDKARNKESGLSAELLAKMKQKNIALGFSLAHLFKAREQAQHFGRITQNIALARKSHIPIIVASLAFSPMDMRSPRDIRSLFEVLGMSSNQSKQAVEYTEQLILRNTQAEGKAVPGINIKKA